jgi:glucose-6-phosphate dehydrogenase assembly protein OpcA
VPDALWSAAETTPAQVEAALRALERESHAEDETNVPARYLNLVAVVDREWRGEVENRLERSQLGASRTVLCSVEEGRTQLAARARISGAGGGEARRALREHVLVDIGPQHLEHLDRIVDPLVVTDVATAVWAPHGHQEAIDALLGLSQVVLHDSADEPDPRTALARALALSEQAYLVDLAWLRTAPWRARVAASFDPSTFRGLLRKVSAVTVRHSEESAMAGLLFLGWLNSRLDWQTGTLMQRDGTWTGRSATRRQDVKLRLESIEMGTRGLSGVTIETADGYALSLDRGDGGLTARRRLPDGREMEWTVLGASRGEPGILGEGIRQALLRDPVYVPALRCAAALASAT